ncbi:hypothetical protein PCE1_001460 [Barthelona sp. PCE]
MDSEGPHAQDIGRPLTLDWVFGFNKNISQACHSLYDNHRTAVFYTAGNTGVVYDVEKDEQTLLQGHTSYISATACSADKRNIATADIGDNSMIVIWDSVTATPLRVIFQPFEYGTAALDFSSNFEYLIALSSPKDNIQHIKIFNWQKSTEAVAEMSFDNEVPFEKVRFRTFMFNNNDEQEIVLTASNRLLFVSLKEGELTAMEPDLNTADFSTPFSAFVDSLFLTLDSLCITATVDGDIIEWVLKEDGTRIAQRVLRLNDGPILTLMEALPFFGIGCQDGTVKMFDPQKRLVAWYAPGAGSILALSFHSPFCKFGPCASVEEPRCRQLLIQLESAILPTIPLPSFVVVTAQGLLLHMDANGFYDDEDQGTIIVEGPNGRLPEVCVHPTLPCAFIIAYSGYLYVYNVDSKALMLRHRFENDVPNCISVLEASVIVGFNSGLVKVFDMNFIVGNDGSPSLELILKQTIEFSKTSVRALDTDKDGTILAVFDSDSRLTVHALCDISPDQYVFVGSYVAHQGDLIDYYLTTDSLERTRLFTVGHDRCMCEFDLHSIDSRNPTAQGLTLRERTLLEVHCDPTSVCYIVRPGSEGKRDLLLTTNFEKQIRIVNPRNQMITKTVRGVDFAINSMKPIPNGDLPPVIVAFSSGSHIGICRLPLDGNPNRYSTVKAHAFNVSSYDICEASDGMKILTSGGSDQCVYMWSVNSDSLEHQILGGGKGMIPFYENINNDEYLRTLSQQLKVIDDDLNDSVIEFLRCLFLYFAVREGASSAESADTVKVKISSLYELFCLLGFYPTNFEMEAIRNELTYRRENFEALNFDQFVKLFINHRRPPVQRDDIQQHLDAIAEPELTTDESVLTFDRLTEVFHEIGDVLDLEEMNEIAEVFSGKPASKLFSNTVNVEQLMEFVGMISTQEYDDTFATQTQEEVEPAPLTQRSYVQDSQFTFTTD